MHKLLPEDARRCLGNCLSHFEPWKSKHFRTSWTSVVLAYSFRLDVLRCTIFEGSKARHRRLCIHSYQDRAKINPKLIQLVWLSNYPHSWQVLVGNWWWLTTIYPYRQPSYHRCILEHVSRWHSCYDSSGFPTVVRLEQALDWNLPDQRRYKDLLVFCIETFSSIREVWLSRCGTCCLGYLQPLHCTVLFWAWRSQGLTWEAHPKGTFREPTNNIHSRVAPH